MPLTGNIGEWSELYVFLKLLGEGILYSADSNTNRIPNRFYRVCGIKRLEQTELFFIREGDQVRIQNALIPPIPTTEFLNHASNILNRINEARGAFDIPEIEPFLNRIGIRTLKARSRDIRDITIVLNDMTTQENRAVGFSIKSQLGSPSTLLNASRATNFTYRIENLHFTEEQVMRINGIASPSRIRDRLNEIERLGGRLVFDAMDNQVFQNNLIMIDGRMPEIIAFILYYYFKNSGAPIANLTNIVTQHNPLNFNLQSGQPFYEYRIKRFLLSKALGMDPATPWNGNYDANGGYIIVKSNGEIVCYHIQDLNQFENYLYQNTKLDTPSMTRHEFGSVFENDGRQFFKLNLQIRFIR